jgi:hypothetical protein
MVVLPVILFVSFVDPEVLVMLASSDEFLLNGYAITDISPSVSLRIRTITVCKRYLGYMACFQTLLGHDAVL